MNKVAYIEPRRLSLATLALPFLSFHAVLAGMLAVLVFSLALRPMADPDIFWHLRNAEYLIRTHHWIRQDTYAYTTLGMPWINHEWLAELPFYFGWRSWGTLGLLGITVLALEIIFFGILCLGYQYCGNLKASWAVTICSVILGTVSFGPRTLLFGWVLFVAELNVLICFENSRVLPEASKRGRILWLLPLFFLLWVNLHGSWLIGFVILLLYFGCGFVPFQGSTIKGCLWTSTERRRFSKCIAFSAAALFVNPYGWRLVAYPFDLAFRQKLNVSRVQEWQQLDLHSIRGRLLLLILVLLIVSFLVRRRTWMPYQLAFVLIGIYAAFTYSRFLFLASILALPILTQDVPWPQSSDQPQRRRVLHFLLLCLTCLIGVRMYLLRASAVVAEKDYPTRALPFLRHWQPQGRVFNDYLWGGYLEQQTPQIPVFVDSRVDIFERRGIFADYLDAIDLKNSLQVLNKYEIRYVLFEKDTPFVYMLRQSPAWTAEYEDETTILFERTSQINLSNGSTHAHL